MGFSSILLLAAPVPFSKGCDERLTGDGADYRGCQTKTRSGETCQRWTSQSPHEHRKTTGNYPSSGLTENFCRNPDGKSGIWCYTRISTSRWEYCDPLPGLVCARSELKGFAAVADRIRSVCKWAVTDSAQFHFFMHQHWYLHPVCFTNSLFTKLDRLFSHKHAPGRSVSSIPHRCAM